MIDSRDLDPFDARTKEALGRYSFQRVESPTGDPFASAWQALDDEFGGRGELERRSVIESWIQQGARAHEGLHLEYFLVIARDADGQLAGVRDCHCVLDVEAGRCVVYLAHVLVLPPFRRTGLGSLFRALPVSLGRQVLSQSSRSREARLLLAAEMESPERDRPATRVRLVAYGKAGFRVICPEALPYLQPDFRDPDAIGTRPKPLPLLALLREVDRPEGETIPKSVTAAFVRHLYAVFGTHCRPEHLEVARTQMNQALASWPSDRVPLLPIPDQLDDVEAFDPLRHPLVLR